MPKFEEDQLIENLARLEHEQWISWASHLKESENLSEDRVKRWEEEWFVPYDQLSEEMKEHDRRWARQIVEYIKALDMLHYANVAEPLWDILDDIDTLSDMLKPAKNAFYEATMNRVAKRFNHLESDGYIVYPPGSRPERTYIDSEREGEPKYPGSVGTHCGEGVGLTAEKDAMFQGMNIGHSDMIGCAIKEGDILVDRDGRLFTVRYVPEHCGFFRLPEDSPEIPERFEDYQSSSFAVVGSLYNDGYCITNRGQVLVELFKKFLPACKLQKGKCADCEVGKTCSLIHTVISTPLVDDAELTFHLKGI